MSALLPLFWIVVGLVLIWFGSELVIKGANNYATRHGWSKSFISLTLLSFCSNLPELTITASGVLKQYQGQDMSALIFGNIIGSNISQITLVLGIAGLIAKLKTSRKEMVGVGAFLGVSTWLLWFAAQDGRISQSEGGALLVIYVVFLLSLPRILAVKTTRSKLKGIFVKKSILTLFQVVAGLVVMSLTSQLILNNATLLADQLGISQSIVAIFIIGLGTSLPELFVTLQAIKKRSVDLSVGTILGSNIVGSSLALGGSALFFGWPVDRAVASFDLSFLFFITIVVTLFLITRSRLERKEAILMLWLYVIYCVLKLLGFR